MAGRLVGWLACHVVPTVPGASSSKPVANPVASPVAYPVAKSGQGLAGLIRRLIRGVGVFGVAKGEDLLEP